MKSFLFKDYLRKIKRYYFHRNRIIKHISGKNNTIYFGSSFLCGKLHIIINGNNNIVSIGNYNNFGGENWIFISGNDNKLIIGDNVTFDGDVHFIQSEGTIISVGDDCMFAKHINIRTSDQHGIYSDERQRLNIAKNVSIGEHVWLCASVLVMKGVKIGGGSIVGIRSMVTKDIPSNCIAVGQPIKVIKEHVNWTREL